MLTETKSRPSELFPSLRRCLVGWMLTVASLTLLLSTGGCADPDPAADLRTAFEELKVATNRVDALLDEIQDVESARERIPEIEENLRRMTAASLEIERNENVQSRKATGLKNEILQFREQRKKSYPGRLLRLKNIPGVEDLMVPVLQKKGQEPPEAQRPPGM